jgi:hypothetical protein
LNRQTFFRAKAWTCADLDWATHAVVRMCVDMSAEAACLPLDRADDFADALEALRAQTEMVPRADDVNIRAIKLRRPGGGRTRRSRT